MSQPSSSQFLTDRQKCVGSSVVVMEDDAFPINQFWSHSLA